MTVYSISEFTEEDLFKTKQTPQLAKKYRELEVKLLEKINDFIQDVAEKEKIIISPIRPIELCLTVDLSISRL